MALFNRHKVEVEVLEPNPTLPKQELRRRAFLPQPPSGEIAELAVEAENLLGYRLLRQHVGAPGPLAAALHKLEIPVFNEQEVGRYQQFMERSLKKSLSDNQDCYWTTEGIGHYNQPIPEFVLRKACQIKKIVPKVEFKIKHLRIGFKSADPFLIAEHGQQYSEKECFESFHIEVWDEPEFEIKL